jgi:hypothetical protein
MGKRAARTPDAKRVAQRLLSAVDRAILAVKEAERARNDLKKIVRAGREGEAKQ